MYLFIILFITTTWLLYYYFHRKFNHWNEKNIKGPKPLILFGNFKDVVCRRKPKSILFKDLYNQYPEEKVVGFYQMTSPVLLIRDLDIVKQVLVKDFKVFPDRSIYFSKKGLGQNMFHSDFETWKILRNQFTSVFTTNKLKAIFHQLVDRGDKFTDDVNNDTKLHTDQDVYKLVMKYATATSMITLFGWDIDWFKDSKCINDYDECLNLSHINEIDSLFPGLMTKFNLSILSQVGINFCHQILETCINQPLSDYSYNLKEIILNLRKQKTINSKQEDIEEHTTVKVTDNLLAGQIWIFYTAGYLNNALILTYAMYHLAHNPHVQDKLRAEIEKNLIKHKGTLTYDALKEMKYLDMVFKETLRINPATTSLIRSVYEDVKLEGTDLTINKGSTVIISPYAIHHDEKYYPEPEKFIPERFLVNNIQNRHVCAYLPFGAGPRSCMGTQFARIQFGICIVKLLQRFRIETSENTCSSIDFDPHHMLMKPEKKIRLRFNPGFN